jgi:D-tyrosyl-tRNA(Tyr) deacylase
MRKAAFVFCTDLAKDPVAAHVWQALRNEFPTRDSGSAVDGRPVLELADVSGNQLALVTTDEVISHDYDRYASILNEQFGDADVIGLVNWHEGANAPNAIFTVQTSGDMRAGTFSPVDPKVTRSLLLAIESERAKADLSAFQCFMEATHWSGVMYGSPGTRVADVKASVVDIEIGSSPDDWGNPAAACVLARSLTRIFEFAEQPVCSLLCVGGVHFEPSFTNAVLETRNGVALAASHILPNHWLVSEGYERDDRLADWQACARSIAGGVDAIVYHDKLKSSYKAQARKLADLLGVQLASHKKLKNPDTFARGIAAVAPALG